MICRTLKCATQRMLSLLMQLVTQSSTYMLKNLNPDDCHETPLQVVEAKKMAG